MRNRMLFLVVVSVALLVLPSTPSSAASDDATNAYITSLPWIVAGDIDRDGDIENDDVLAMLQAGVSNSDPLSMSRGDVNGDGLVTLADALIAAQPGASTSCGIAPPGYNVIESDAPSIVGTTGRDFICAGDSDNTISGNGQTDIIYGGGGNDIIWGGYGTDLILGGDGNDEIDGGPGDDVIDGGADIDVCVGSAEPISCENSANGSVVVYDDPGVAAGVVESQLYAVNIVHNGVDYPSYVNASVNNNTKPNGAGGPEQLLTTAEREAKFRTDSNHWTSFEFDGSVMVSVDLPAGATGANVLVRPAHKNIVPIVSGGSALFEITEPGQYYLAVEGVDRHPLFIFANDIADAPPAVADSNVFTAAEVLANPALLDGGVNQTIYFSPGIHVIAEPVLNVDGTLDAAATELAGFPLIPSNTTIYVDGGAYVKGLLAVAANVQNVHIRGYGVLSGFDYPHQSTGWSNHLILFTGYNGSSDLSVEGITLVDGPKTCITARSGPIEVVNIKCLGWHANTDGIAVGTGAQVRDSFLKIFDDVIKLFHSNITVDSIVIWHQQTGAAFQLSWNLQTDVTNVRVSNIDIIAVEREQGTVLQTGGSAIDYAPGERANGGINNALVNARNFNGGTISDVVFNNIRYDAQPFQLAQLQLKDHRSGFTSGVGGISAVTISNVTMPEAPRIDSYILDNGVGEITNITFADLYANGAALDPSAIRIDETTNPS